MSSIGSFYVFEKPLTLDPVVFGDVEVSFNHADLELFHAYHSVSFIEDPGSKNRCVASPHPLEFWTKKQYNSYRNAYISIRSGCLEIFLKGVKLYTEGQVTPIKRIEVSESDTLTVDDFVSLQSISPKLNSANGLTFVKPCCFEKFGRLPNKSIFKDLSVCNVDLSAVSLTGGFIAGLREMEEISFIGCDFVGGFLAKLPHLPLPKLKSVAFLDSQGLDVEGLENLIKIAQNVEEVCFSGCLDLEECLVGLLEGDEMDKIILQALKKCDLTDSDANYDALDALLKLAPNLGEILVEELDFSALTAVDELLCKLPEGSLPTLEKMYLSRSDVSKKGLNALLKAAPNLKAAGIFL